MFLQKYFGQITCNRDAPVPEIKSQQALLFVKQDNLHT
jgi:hypothetical protein